MRVFHTRSDLVTYLEHTHPHYADHGMLAALATAVEDEDHPAWGEDWAPWLADALPAIRQSVERMIEAEDCERYGPSSGRGV